MIARASTLVALAVAASACSGSAQRWIVEPVPDSIVVVGEGWRSVLPAGWTTWSPKGIDAGAFWRSPDGSRVAGGLVRAMRSAKHFVLDMKVDPDPIPQPHTRSRIGHLVGCWHRWIGDHAVVEIEVGDLPRGDVYFHEWRAFVLVDDDHVLFASCSSPEETAQTNTRACEAFFANVRFAGD